MDVHDDQRANAGLLSITSERGTHLPPKEQSATETVHADVVRDHNGKNLRCVREIGRKFGPLLRRNRGGTLRELSERITTVNGLLAEMADEVGTFVAQNQFLLRKFCLRLENSNSDFRVK